ncbi:RNA polymerase I associated factor, A49-like protein [Hyaloraphidium curvatum]|nr:RNA polymerase I associated factor, A49-like protein [Hyaloraphidium curvatum]
MARPADAVFDVFESAGGPERKRRRLAVAETDRVVLSGVTNPDDELQARYLVAVYDPETKATTLRHAPVFRASRSVKAAAAAGNAAPSATPRRKNLDARNVLGEAFGSKKRQQQIRSYERNQVEMDNMGEVVDLVSTVIENRVAKSVPAVAADGGEGGSRPTVPPHNLNAAKPEDAYELDAVFVPGELADVDIAELWGAADYKPILQSYGIVQDSFCHSLLDKELSNPKGQRSKDRVKRLVYVAILVQLYAILGGPNKSYQGSASLAARLGGVPTSLAQSLLDRFAMQRGDDPAKPSYGVTSQLKDKLACYIIVAFLALENFDVDLTQVAKDLKQSLKKVADLAKYVGCKMVKKAPPKDGGKAPAQQVLRAVLTVPLVFPVPSRGRK